ncbi:MAG TPA: hypothetical protein VHY91_07525 [Pirellulales bacterium]|jgi:hypothetical protein|nr:hypothetical protein [Pirellulales bacterium]
MKTRRILLLAVCGLCLSGCKSGKGNQELLERELRCQEDHIYDLEAALDQCEAELESARRENQTLKRDGGGGDQGPRGSSNVPIIEMPSDSSSPRSSPRGRPQEPSLPIVEPGEEFVPTPANPGASARPEPTDRQIARIVLNKQLTGGLRHQRQGGDEGILVVFEPRNARGEMVAEPGDVSIALVDPERSGPQARVARWDFAAAEAFEQFHRSGPLGRGYEFELPWPDAAPQNKKLDLFVRYIAPDGRKLMSKMTITVDPPAGGQARRWRAPAGAMSETDGSAPSASSDRAARIDRRRRFFRSAPERAPRDTEAPAFAGAGSDPSAPAGTSEPKIELGEESSPGEADPPATARNSDPPPPVARRPAWTPYR